VVKVATIADVARVAGLSKAAVSRYLNRRINLPIETQRRIDEAIRELDFKSNSLARRLSIGSSEMIGLAMPQVSNPFFAELADAAEEAAAELGFGIALCITRSMIEHERRYLGWLDTRYIDGLMLITNRPDDGELRDLIGKRENIVLLDEDVPGTEVTKIFADNVAGAVIATERLIAAGPSAHRTCHRPTRVDEREGASSGLRRGVVACRHSL
jgi:LacI family transcriptional regulator